LATHRARDRGERAGHRRGGPRPARPGSAPGRGAEREGACGSHRCRSVWREHGRGGGRYRGGSCRPGPVVGLRRGRRPLGVD
jgi:hypothetical protein